MRISKLNPLNRLDFLLQVKGENRGPVQIFFWWELRRILYNLIVGVVGVLCIETMLTFIPSQGSLDVPEPVHVAAFAVLCNICYCLGWFTELLFNPGKKYGPFCFKLGLGFTLCVMFLIVIDQIITYSI